MRIVDPQMKDQALLDAFGRRIHSILAQSAENESHVIQRESEILATVNGKSGMVGITTEDAVTLGKSTYA